MAAKKNSAFMKPVQISEELAEIVGRGPMPRTEITKKLWTTLEKTQTSRYQKTKETSTRDAKLGNVWAIKRLTCSR